MSEGVQLSEEDLKFLLEQSTGPRVTLDGIKGEIVNVTYYRHGQTATICAVDLVNGFTVFGHSACAAPENYDEAVGRHYSFEHAIRQIWPLEGYRLRSKLFEEGLKDD
jgi:hypothetical protein